MTFRSVSGQAADISEKSHTVTAVATRVTCIRIVYCITAVQFGFKCVFNSIGCMHAPRSRCFNSAEQKRSVLLEFYHNDNTYLECTT